MALVDYFSGNPVASESAIQGRKSRMESVTLLALLLCPTVYLSVRHGIHVCLFVLLVLALWHIFKAPANYRQLLAEPWIKPLLLAFAALTLATAVTQALNTGLHWSSYDGPSKILLASLVFLYLRTRDVSFSRVLQVGLPLGLLATGLAVQLNSDPNVFWGGRLTTTFVDPNSLGSQTLMLTLLCLFSIGLFGKEPAWLLLLKLVGIGTGIYITVHTQSRGGWLTIPPLLVLWLVLQFSRIKDRRAMSYLKPIGLALAAVATLILGHEYSTIIANRGEHAIQDISNWLNEINLDSPAGIRLSIWKISLSLALDSPWFGYGEAGLKAALSGHPLNVPAYRSAIETLALAGPHSDILAKLLFMGLVGLLAYLATLVIPAIYFWRHRDDSQTGSMAASHLGLYFIVGMLFCGLTNEMLSLKYLCSFFGLMIAGLAADVAKRVK